MNRQIAYRLLSTRLQILASQELRQLDQDEFVTGSDGRCYVMSFSVVGSKLHGQISDQNTAKFELLEEVIDIK